MGLKVLVESHFSPLGPHYLSFVKVKFLNCLLGGVFVPLDMVPPEALPHQGFYELVVVSDAHLVLVIRVVGGYELPDAAHGYLRDILENALFAGFFLVLKVGPHYNTLDEVI